MCSSQYNGLIQSVTQSPHKGTKVQAVASFRNAEIVVRKEDQELVLTLEL